MKKILLILILLLSNCGYQPIYTNKNLVEFEFSNVKFIGEKDINRLILNSLSIKEKSDKNLNELLVKSDLEIEETSKDSKGKVQTYRMIIDLELSIIKNKEILKKKIIKESFSYNNQNNKFELIEYETEIKENIVKKIIEEISLYLNLQ